MLKPAPPIPNVERQRQFRERNPGYYRKYYARKKSIRLAAVAQRKALALANAAPAAAEVVPAFAEPLMLPAPVEPLVLPGLNAIPTREQLAAQAEREILLVPTMRRAA
jgi:hypothetical protein